MTKQELTEKRAKLLKELEEVIPELTGHKMTEADRKEVMEMTEADFTPRDVVDKLVKDILRNTLWIKKVDFIREWMELRGVSRATAYRQIDMMIAEGGFLKEPSPGQLTINLPESGFTQEEITAFRKERRTIITQG